VNITSRPITQKTDDRVNNKLRESAKYCPHCMGCGLSNPNGDALCLAHSNLQEDGKGRGLKARNDKGAIVCGKCHDLIDMRTGKLSRYESQQMHASAHARTVAWWEKMGLLK
jgi:CO dehydrogenase/acetyl-CoA synthase alpha subunit